MKEAACPVCRSKSRLENNFSDIFLYRCAKCDHCFTDVSSLKAQEKYNAEYYVHKHKNWNAHPDFPLFRRLGRQIAAHKKDADVLDVGCGNGDLLRYLRQTQPGLSLTGIDLQPGDNLAGVKVIKDNYLTHGFGKKFDVLVSLQTIEHLDNLEEFISRLSAMMKPGGLVIVSTVNDRSVTYTAARLLNKAGFHAAFERLYSRHHLNHFNMKSLKILLGSRFKIVKTLHHNEPLMAVDMPPVPAPVQWFLRFGVWCTFVAGKVTGKTVLQTVVCRQI